MRHPDEGEIHAWLDGALDSATAAGLEAHVAACPACSGAVADARGLIAGASRILLALDDVPAGVIPAAPTVPAATDSNESDELAGRRARQQRIGMAPARRHIPWYARRPVQIAAGLMLVAGVGGVVASNAGKSADRVFIEIDTDMAPAGRGPAAGVSSASSARTPAPDNLAASLPPVVLPPQAGSTLGGVPTATPAPPPPSVPAELQLRSPAASRAVDRAEQAVADLSSLGGGAVTQAPGQQFEQRKAANQAAEKMASRDEKSAVVQQTPMAPPPPMPAAAGVGSRVAAGGAAGMAATASAAVAAPMPLMDSALVAFAADSARLRRKATERQGVAVAGTIAGKVIAGDDTPIGAAMVSVVGVNIAAQTAADGSFSLPPLPPGRYALEARRIGYAPARVDGVVVASGDTAFARVALQPAALRLNEAVVLGAAAKVAKTADVGGACFALDVDPGADDVGIPLLPRRVRIRMAQSSFASAAGGAAGGLLTPPPAAAPRPFAADARSESSAPLPWTPISADSVDATWVTERDVITLRLEIRGSTVRGTATSTQSVPTRTAKVDGRKVSCTGGS